MSQHSLFKKQLEHKAVGAFPFPFGQEDDRNRDLSLTVLVFNGPRCSCGEISCRVTGGCLSASTGADTTTPKKALRLRAVRDYSAKTDQRLSRLTTARKSEAAGAIETR